MARAGLTVGIFAIAALCAADPAAAQFGSIFSDSPPRPPADVPGSAPSHPAQPQYYPQQPQYYPPQPQPQRAQPPSPYYPSQAAPQQVPQRPYYESQAPRPPAGLRADEPPAQPLPAPMNLPPSGRPGGGSIQSQDLAPPPGADAAPAPAPQQGQPGQTQPGIARTTPGVSPAAPQPADTSLQPGDEVVVEPPPQRIANPTAVFSGLDKVTGRIISFDVALNETVQFGALQVTPRVCYSRPPTETPNTDAFVEVDEVTLQGEIKRIFTGWMFAASPGLHAVEHPIYDVWITDCKGGRNPAVADAPEAAPPAAKPVPARNAPQRRAPARVQPRAQQPGVLPPFR